MRAFGGRASPLPVRMHLLATMSGEGRPDGDGRRTANTKGQEPVRPAGGTTRRKLLSGIRAVLFDMDGTLVEVPHDWKAIRKALGIGPGSILDQLHALPEPERSRRLALLDAMETDACDAARPAPGAAELLGFLRRSGIATALVTNNSAASARTVLERFGWTFSAVITRDDGTWKPSPEPLFRAAAALGVPIGACAAIGDAWLDREAARAAGCRALWLVGPEAERSGRAAELAAPDLAGLLERLRESVETPSPTGS